MNVRISYEKVLDWLVPSLLALLGGVGIGVCTYLSGITEKLAEMNANLRVVLFRQDATDQTVENTNRRIDETKTQLDDKVERVSRRIDETNRRVETIERTMLGVKNP